MERIDFEHGTVTGNIFGAALPMLVAQILSLLYNIVDRVYIARIPEVGTAALGAVGLCFPAWVKRKILSMKNRMSRHSIQQLVWKRRRSAVFD